MTQHIQPRAGETIGRRDFLKTGMAAAVGTAVLGAAVSVADESPTDALQIAKRPFGKTGLELPILGYGGAALPKAWLNPLTTEQRVDLAGLQYTEVESQGKRFLLRSDLEGTCAAVFRAVGVAIPPSVQRIGD